MIINKKTSIQQGIYGQIGMDGLLHYKEERSLTVQEIARNVVKRYNRRAKVYPGMISDSFKDTFCISIPYNLQEDKVEYLLEERGCQVFSDGQVEAVCSECGKAIGFTRYQEEKLFDTFDGEKAVCNQCLIKYKSEGNMKEICERCNGTGVEVSDWDFDRARANPKTYNDYRIEKEHGKNSGVISLLNVVSPLYFNDEGKELCYGCHGSGKSREFVQQEADNKSKEQADFFKNLIGSDLEVECPEDSQFLTIQAYCNDSNGQVDYFNSHQPLSKEYVIAIVPGKQRRESTARKAMVPFVDLYQPWDKWTWHKEDYSGGHGYWLESFIKGDYPYKAYDGREEVPFWYEVSFNSYTKKMRASKWLANAMNKEIQTKEETMPEEIIEEKTEKYLIIDVPISLFNRIVELEDKQEFSGDVDHFNSLLEAAEVGKDKKSNKVKLDAQAYLYALKRFPEIEEVLSGNGDEKILLKSLSKVVSKMVTDGTKLFTDGDFTEYLTDEESEPKKEEKPVKKTKAEPKKTEVEEKPKDTSLASKSSDSGLEKRKTQLTTPGKVSRLSSVVKVLQEGPISLEELINKSDKFYGANGGKENPKEQKADVGRVLQVVRAGGWLIEKDGKFSIKN